MASSVPSDNIDEQAARWAARAAYGDMPSALARAFDAWMAADRRHRGAYLRARAGLYAAEDAVLAKRGVSPSAVLLAGNDDAAMPGTGIRPPWGGKARWALGGAVAASLLAVVGIGLPMLNRPGPGQVAAADHILTLSDGSAATLGDGARIEFAMGDGVRKVVLVQGEATFHVAKDRAHPFVVQSGDVYAQATGTVYSVRRIGKTGGAVRVDEGSVLVWGRDERDQAVLLHAGGALTLEPGPRLPVAAGLAQPTPPAPPPPELAQISLDNVTIAAAALRFNRINRTQIVIADPAIGEVRVVGLFRANDPQHFADAAAAVAGGEVRQSKDRIEIKLK
ncbi:MAG: FecR domain-containing protein [Pseudomonadota bacterium]